MQGGIDKATTTDYMQCVVSLKKATIQIQISALIQTTYCISLKFIIAFERRMRKKHSCIHMGDEEKLLII